MAKLIVLVMAGMLLFLLACGSGAESEELGDSSTDLSVTSQSKSGAGDEAGVSPAAAAPSFAVADAGDGRVAPGLALQTVQREVISSATLSIKVKVVEEVIGQIRAIAEGMGGFVEQLSSSGAAGRQQA